MPEMHEIHTFLNNQIFNNAKLYFPGVSFAALYSILFSYNLTYENFRFAAVVVRFSGGLFSTFAHFIAYV